MRSKVLVCLTLLTWWLQGTSVCPLGKLGTTTKSFRKTLRRSTCSSQGVTVCVVQLPVQVCQECYFPLTGLPPSWMSNPTEMMDCSTGHHNHSHSGCAIRYLDFMKPMLNPFLPAWSWKKTSLFRQASHYRKTAMAQVVDWRKPLEQVDRNAPVSCGGASALLWRRMRVYHR